MKVNYSHPDPVAYALLQRLCAACDAIERPLSNIGPTPSGEETRADLAWANALARELGVVLERLAEREGPKYLDTPLAYAIRQPEITGPPPRAMRQAEYAIKSAAGCLL